MTSVSSTRTALVGGRYLDPEGHMIAGDLLLEDGLVVDVATEVDSSASIRRIDCSGKTVLPGLIDLHFHLTIPGRSVLGTPAQTAMRAVRQSLRVIRAGTTTVRNLGGEENLDSELRELIAAGLIPGPDIISSGRFLHITGGHCYPTGFTADGVHEVSRGVREQIFRGADWVKVMCSGGYDRLEEVPSASEYSSEELEAAVASASLRGVKVAAHAHHADAIKMAVRAGASSVEHCSYPDQEAIKLLIENEVFIVPTIAVYEVVGEKPGHPSRDRQRKLAADKRRTFREVYDAGVKWGIGSDGGLGMPMELLLDELILMVDLVGLSPREVLLKATAGNAELLGLGDVGSIAVGKKASLVVIDGDPIENIHDITRIVATVVGGRVFEWPMIDRAFNLFEVPLRDSLSVRGNYADRATPERTWRGAYL